MFLESKNTEFEAKGEMEITNIRHGGECQEMH